MTEQFKTRQQRREEARQAAKLLVQGDSTTKLRSRWNISLTCVLGVMAVGIVLFPPQTPLSTGVWLVLMFAVGVYPALHLAEWALPIKRKWIPRVIAILVLAGATVAFGKLVWPIPHHQLSAKQRAELIRVLSSQKELRSEIKIG